MNRKVFGLIVLVVVISIGFVSVQRDGTITAPNPSPRRVEWDYFPVGGMMLLNPMVADSLGRHPSLLIPPGSMLGVPRLVAEPGPNQPRTGT